MIETGSVEVDGIGVFYRRRPGRGTPAVLVHGVPDHSEQWQPFLERMRSPALALDLPGFGRSQRPAPERFAGTAAAHAEFFARALERLGVGRYRLLVHDWGAVALVAAQREPERVERLCLIDAVPLLPGYRWHRTARIWRTPLLGELSTRLPGKRLLALALRESRGDWSAAPAWFVELIWDRFDAGTAAAILRLYRSAPPAELERLGAALGRISAPALVVWAQRDRYLPARFGRAYAQALPEAELLELPRAGHWPWVEQPELVARVVAFIEGREPPRPV